MLFCILREPIEPITGISEPTNRICEPIAGWWFRRVFLMLPLVFVSILLLMGCCNAYWTRIPAYCLGYWVILIILVRALVRSVFHLGASCSFPPIFLLSFVHLTFILRFSISQRLLIPVPYRMPALCF
jgi:hypothetical protein